MPIALIQCRGKCKKKKSVAFFQPADVKSARPICRACRKAYREQPTGRDRGWYWRRMSNTLCPGSALAMAELEGTTCSERPPVSVPNVRGWFSRQRARENYREKLGGHYE